MTTLNLKQALKLQTASRMTFLGEAEGLPLLISLARSWSEPILLVSSLPLTEAQTRLADLHLAVERPWNLTDLAFGLDQQLTLISGAALPEGGFDGLTANLLEGVNNLARLHGVPLLLLAQNAYVLSLNAGAELVSPVPTFSDAVVLLNAISQPDKLLAADGSAAGGLFPKIQAGVPKIMLLMGVENEMQKAQAGTLAQKLLTQATAIVSVAGDGEVHAVYQRTAGVILAAGESQRLGTPKQLLEWEGETFIRRIVRTAQAAGLSPVVVVLGAHAEDIRPVLSESGAEVVLNADWQEGQSASLRAGIAVLPPENGAAVFLLADQPQVPQTLIRALVDKHATSLAPIVIPEIDGQRGNPVLFDAALFPELMQVAGDQGGRAIFARHTAERILWLDPIMTLDVDTPQDYQRLLDWYKGQADSVE